MVQVTRKKKKRSHVWRDVAFLFRRLHAAGLHPLCFVACALYWIFSSYFLGCFCWRLLFCDIPPFVSWQWHGSMWCIGNIQMLKEGQYRHRFLFLSLASRVRSRSRPPHKTTSLCTDYGHIRPSPPHILGDTNAKGRASQCPITISPVD